MIRSRSKHEFFAWSAPGHLPQRSKQVSRPQYLGTASRMTSALGADLPVVARRQGSVADLGMIFWFMKAW
jgi:hypothetical protein